MLILENYHVQRFLSLAVSGDSKEIREYEHNKALPVTHRKKVCKNAVNYGKI